MKNLLFAILLSRAKSAGLRIADPLEHIFEKAEADRPNHEYTLQETRSLLGRAFKEGVPSISELGPAGVERIANLYLLDARVVLMALCALIGAQTPSYEQLV